jgi:hypothetical protein
MIFATRAKTNETRMIVRIILFEINPYLLRRPEINTDNST